MVRISGSPTSVVQQSLSSRRTAEGRTAPHFECKCVRIFGVALQWFGQVESHDYSRVVARAMDLYCCAIPPSRTKPGGNKSS